MNIRTVVASDVPALVCVEQTQPRCAQWGENGWHTELKGTASQIWGACEDKELVGFIALRLAAGVCEILNLGVRPDYCRRGIGAQLIRHAVESVRKQGGEVITLEVHAQNVPAIHLYQRAGFSPVGVRKQFYTDGQDAWVMRITL
ncbi:MAG: ribosomal protein S18-alanine N-acetyltransferase [Elusimicrobiaceae bacterium]|nr:ribosomal protein S18-alanine N-acetyltransferase [Elusimicrobiaceae bacterium]